MAACLRLLRAERRPERVDASKRHGGRFEIQLTALREVRLLVVEVFHREQRRRALAGRWREDRRIGQDETARVEEIADRVDHLVANAEDRSLTLAADPEVA